MSFRNCYWHVGLLLCGTYILFDLIYHFYPHRPNWMAFVRLNKRHVMFYMKSQIFPVPVYLTPPLKWFPLEFWNGGETQKHYRMMPQPECQRSVTVVHSFRHSTGTGQTVGQTWDYGISKLWRSASVAQRCLTNPGINVAVRSNKPNVDRHCSVRPWKALRFGQLSLSAYAHWTGSDREHAVASE